MSNSFNQAAIASNVVLVRLSISKWSGRKLDKQVSAETKATKGATDKARVAVYKSIVSDDILDAIGKVENKARILIRKHTVPWAYDGISAMHASGLAAFMTEAKKLQAEFLQLADSFVPQYAATYQDMRAHLGEMFNESDYPAPACVRCKFGFEVCVEQIPLASDFRVQVGLDAETIAKIKADNESRINATLAAAQKNAWERIAKVVEAMIEKLREYTGRKDGTFRDTLVTNIRDLVAMLPALNVTNDSDMTLFAARIERELCAKSPDELKEDSNARAIVAQSAEAIMRDIWEKRKAARTVAAPIASDTAAA